MPLYVFVPQVTVTGQTMSPIGMAVEAATVFLTMSEPSLGFVDRNARRVVLRVAVLKAEAARSPTVAQSVYGGTGPNPRPSR